MYYVYVEIQGISGSRVFGPIKNLDVAEDLLLTLAARENVLTAKLEKQEQ